MIVVVLASPVVIIAGVTTNNNTRGGGSGTDCLTHSNTIISRCYRKGGSSGDFGIHGSRDNISCSGVSRYCSNTSTSSSRSNKCYQRNSNGTSSTRCVNSMWC